MQENYSKEIFDQVVGGRVTYQSVYRGRGNHSLKNTITEVRCSEIIRYYAPGAENYFEAYMLLRDIEKIDLVCMHVVMSQYLSEPIKDIACAELFMERDMIRRTMALIRDCGLDKRG